MIYVLLTMFLGKVFWAFHDCYFWDDLTRKLVDRFVGWHVVKALMLLFTGASIFYFGYACQITFQSIASVLLTQWAAFEMGMNLATREKDYAHVFDWARALKLMFRKPEKLINSMQIKRSKSNALEFMFQYLFRLNWVEACFVLVVVNYILLKLL